VGLSSSQRSSRPGEESGSGILGIIFHTLESVAQRLFACATRQDGRATGVDRIRLSVYRHSCNLTVIMYLVSVQDCTVMNDMSVRS
jgi:hypothetical protein